jgi:hypothetical protein
MSTKKAQSYSSIVGDIKVNDKSKGKNYKSYMKKLEENNNDKEKVNRREKESRLSLLDKRIIDRRKLSSSSSNFNKFKEGQYDSNNKIDIKISVNYSKQNSGLNSTKSKSFYQISNPSNGNTIPSSKQSQYMNTYSDNFYKTNKVNQNSIDLKKTDNSIEIEQNIKKRNCDKFYHSNLNISFNNFENKPMIHTMYTANAINNSFGKDISSFSNKSQNIDPNVLYESCNTGINF